jgi:NADH:ubiquinone oxidoreductase subunit 5 (subunit L)/multisubunit Na+/H+ antiporter MnhA subunit
VAFALVQHDLKRLLAYHSIENIGIIVSGIGVGLVATANGAHGIAFLGYAGALLHVWNHSLFKGLLFLSAGAVIHATGTREIDRLGGLAKRMPWTSGAFVLGAVAICGLPPLNGFVSEWLLYVAGFEGVLTPGAGWTWLLVVAVGPALAFTGALALACFVKAFGAVFLGSSRSSEAALAEEAPASMRWAMVPLAAGCVAIGLLPALFLPVLSRVVRVVSGLAASDRLGGSLWQLQFVGLVVAVVGAAGVLLLLRVVRRRQAMGTTWDCGYAGRAGRAQYTSSSLASTIAGYFTWAMPADVHAPGKLGLFPVKAAFESHVPDTVLDRALLPAIRNVQRLVGFARQLRSARVQMYLLSLGATLVILLIWSAS